MQDLSMKLQIYGSIRFTMQKEILIELNIFISEISMKKLRNLDFLSF